MSDETETREAEMWVVLALDDEDMPPLAAFPTEAEARAWVTLTGWDPSCRDVGVCKAAVTIELAPGPTGSPAVEGDR